MKIRPRKHKSGRVTWQLDAGVIKGRRYQKLFKTKELAQMERARLKGEKLRIGNLAHEITDEERLLYTALREKLAAVGATISQAVEFFLKHAKPVKELVTFEELRTLCGEAKENDRSLTADYVKQFKAKAEAFGLSGADAQLAHEISTEAILTWLDGNEWAWKTWNNYRVDLHTLFGWGVEKGYLMRNPVAEIPPKPRPIIEGEGDIEFLRFAQCETLLRRAAMATEGALPRDRRGAFVEVDKEKEDYRLLVPALVIGLYTGLRPEKEIGQMKWQSILLDEALVVVSQGRAKTRQRRTVALSDNAVAWLRWCKAQGMGESDDEPILPRNFTKRWKRLRQVCKVFDNWPHDGMRRTFATMHLAFYEDEKKLQLFMGHRSAQMIWEHYRGLVKRAEAEKFWALKP